MKYFCVLLLLAFLVIPNYSATIIIPDDYLTIQEGIDNSIDGDTVLLLPGIYFENINFRGHNIILGSLFLTTGDTNYISQTIIDGSSAGSVISITAGEDSTTIIAGLTMRNGDAETGGGIHCAFSNPLFAHIRITDNAAENGGGGMDIFGCSPTLICCMFSDNFAINFGGGLSNDLSAPTLINCVFSGNTTTGNGGGISNYTHSNAIIINCVFWGNSAAFGGAMWNGWSSPVVTNCIFWANEPVDIYAGIALVTYSDIQGGCSGEGNIDIDPLFHNPDNGDFHLMATYCGDPHDSPCIDMGHPDILDSRLDCDWGLGELRSDLGAYGGGDSIQIDIDNFITRLPSHYCLIQNYPNPFNTSTIIQYELPQQSQVEINIYDILGRQVASLQNGSQKAGYHSVKFKAEDLTSGIYLYRLQADEYTETKKMLLMK
jgi:hypothetical protein